MEKCFDPRFSFSGSFVASPPAADQSNINFALFMKIIERKMQTWAISEILKSFSV
jgi:hypothetical protein